MTRVGLEPRGRKGESKIYNASKTQKEDSKAGNEGQRKLEGIQNPAAQCRSPSVSILF